MVWLPVPAVLFGPSAGLEDSCQIENIIPRILDCLDGQAELLLPLWLL
jgi:hypothetical protein